MRMVFTSGANLDELIVETSRDHYPIRVVGQRGAGVLLSAEDWNAIEETLYLHSLPGVAASIREGMAEPIESCSKDIDL